MIPVRLRLKNFLSYGENAGELDFEAFDLACLSGGNGQGKSALLDAITWAVWGEARKAAGALKPDEELLRAGAREMEVEFAFDIEGTRYRIVRSYARTASGKTSKPGLEFHVLEDAGAAWHPLTAESVRATQSVIDRRIGIDYDTFINSAFLLQGRSDEFTRRKPAERKEVLGRILGLDRYERLAAVAAEKWTEARNRERGADEEIARLKRALEDEPAWRREHQETEAAAAAARDDRDALVAEEAALAARHAALDDDERRAEQHRTALARIEERRARINREEGGLRSQIADAETLVSRAEEIAAAHARYDALHAERATLDARADEHRALTRRVEELQLQRRTSIADLERGLERQEAGLASNRERLADDLARLAGLEAAQKGHRNAEAAAERARELEVVREKRERLTRQQSDLEALLAEARNELLVQLRQAESAVEEVEALPTRLESLRATAGALAARLAELQQWSEERDAVRDRGAERRARQSHARGDLERLIAEADALRARRDRIRQATDETCPTCGTPLTDEHRHAVEGTYDRELEAVEERVAARRREIEDLENECATLVDAFRAVEARIAEANGAVRTHDMTVAEIQRLEGQLELAAEWRTGAETLRARIDAGEYEPLAHKELARVEKKLQALPLDMAELDAAREAAAHLKRWTATLEELSAVARRRDGLLEQIAAGETEAARLREEFESGAAVAPVDEALARLEEQIGSLAYDPAQHERIRAALAELADVPHELARLASARTNLEDWTRRLEALAGEDAVAAAESAEHRQVLDALVSVLAERPALAARMAAVRDRREFADRTLDDAQARLGGLAEKLARAALDRSLLRSTQADLKRAKHDAQVTRHLRQAFGPHGIPSLIIEETLPEVEDRANELLERLSGGRTRVALETQREKKAGGTKETLEIRITDEQGMARPYETYSGGEAFRVDFALRIALSQLLAERAGVRIRTLVIDEGFGTQDQEGLQGLVDSIRAVQGDFDKILVITHMEEIKDAFPVRIEVTKSPVDGSTFSVIGA